ncbi:MAG: DUF3368 domain-containing protein [Saprospiraceae bacterium]|nr:DUF3368 domain-containing protein [Saprospiraceae bacterium]
MIIVSDASPIIALHNIGYLSLLEWLYGSIKITDIVEAELEIELPHWMLIDTNYESTTYQSLNVHLDAGEASSIALALQYPDSVLIIDERRGRKVASSLNIEIIGLLGVIVKSKKEGKILAGMPIIQALQKQGFRVSDELIAIVKERLQE